MPDLGLGAAPMGSTPFGFGAPMTLNSTSAKLYLSADGARRNSAQINSVTGDLVRDASNGLHAGMDSVSQQVYLALRTLRGSAIVQRLGIAFSVKIINETTSRKLADEVYVALADLTSRQLIEVVSVDSERIKVTGIRVSVKWRNLTNGETNVTRWENG